MKVKKIMILILVMLLVSTTSFALTINYDGIEREYTGPNVTLILNETTFVPSAEQMPPIIIEDRTLVPVREVFEMLGGKVEWDGTTSTVTIKKPVLETNLASIFESAEYKNKKSELVDNFDELLDSADEGDSFVKIYNMCDESEESFIDFAYYMACINDLGGTFNIPLFDFETTKSIGGSKLYAKYSELKEYAIENEKMYLVL